jgi:mevalonate pyrophosphate decarboxylase
VLLTEDKEKEVSSTAGMRRSTETSELLIYRNGIASARIKKVE